MTLATVLVVAAGGVLRGLDRRTGEELWIDKLAGGGYGTVGIQIHGDLIVASANSAMAFGLEYPTGKLLWSAPTHTEGRATIWLDERHVMVAKGGHLDCYDRDGTRLWKSQLEGSGHGSVAMGVPGNVSQADAAGGTD